MTTTAQFLENAGAINHARDFRRIWERMLGYDVVQSPGTGSGGIFRTGDLAVTQRAAGANMSVDVAVGLGYADGSQSSVQGGYIGFVDAVTNVAIDPSDPSNPRYDLIGFQVRDTEYTAGSDDGRIVVIKGTAAAVPAEPAAPNNFVTLARVTVGAGVTSITDANILDRRLLLALLGGFIIRTTSADFPAVNNFHGQVGIDRTAKTASIWDGSAWVALGQYARAWTFIAEATPNNAIVSFTSIPQTYKDLRLRLAGQGNFASSQGNVLMRLNGVTGTVYNYEDLSIFSGTVTPLNTNNVTSALVGTIAGTTSTGSNAGMLEILFPDYATTNWMKTWWANSYTAPSGNQQGRWIGGHKDDNNNAITQIDLHANAIATGFVNGTIASLEGRR